MKVQNISWAAIIWALFVLAGPVAGADVSVSVVVLSSPSSSDTTETLPSSVSSVSQGQDYYVEVWASDVGGTNTGSTSVYVDMIFAPSDAASVRSINHGGIFTVFPSGTVGTGKIDELGGSSLTAAGVEPQWARVATVRMRAEATGAITFSLAESSTGIAAMGRGLIAWSQVDLGEATLIVREPTQRPTVTTQSATNVEKTSAALRGSIQDDGGQACQHRFRYKKSGGSYGYTSWAGSKTTGQQFSQGIISLSPGSVYYFNAQAKNSAGEGVWGNEQSFTTRCGLTISSSAGGSVIKPGEAAFEYACGTVVSIEAEAATGYHFVNWTGTAVDAGKLANPNATDTTVTVDGGYTLRANFLPITGPTVSTQSATNVEKTSATLRGSIQYGGGQACQYRFRYKKSGGSYGYTSWAGSKTTGQQFSQGISGLSPGSVYYFNAQAKNSAGEGVWGNEQSFTTRCGLTISSSAGGSVIKPGEAAFEYACGTVVSIEAEAATGYHFVNWTGTAVDTGKLANPNAAETTVTVDGGYTLRANFLTITGPTVSTQSATNVEKTSAALWGLIDDDGGQACQYRFSFKKAGGSYVYTPWIDSKATGQSFSCTIAYLSPGSVYYFNAQAKNSAGTSAWGNEQSFTTVAELTTLLILTPNGGEELVAGSMYEITWQTEGAISDVLIEYSTNNDGTWTQVDPPNSGNSGSYDWLVPEVTSDQCLVRISDAGRANIFDTSDAVFTISKPAGPVVAGLVGHWKLNEASGIIATDSSCNNNHGRLVGNPVWVAGKIGGAIELDGISDHIDVPTFDMDTDTATFMAWIKGPKAVDWAGIIFSRDIAGNVGCGMHFGADNTLHYSWNNNSPETFNWSGGPVIPQNQWAMVAVVIEPTKATAYVYTEADGLAKGVNHIAHIPQRMADLKIGWDIQPTPGLPDRRFDGIIDDVRIYNYALSEDQIEALIAISWLPVAHYRFEANANDTSGNGLHCTEMPGATALPSYEPGIDGQAIRFHGDGSHVVNDNFGRLLNGLDALTVCAWVKSNVTGTDRGFIIFEEPTGSDSRCMRYGAAGFNGGGTNLIKCGITAADGEQKLESSDNTQTTQWQHLAMVWSSGNPLKLYINGVQDTPWRQLPDRTGSLAGYTKLIIGKGGKYSDPGTDAMGWDGLVDDVRIYNYALSGDEIIQVLCIDPPISDLNGDCKVDFKDLAIFVSEWLKCTLPVEELCWQ